MLRTSAGSAEPAIITIGPAFLDIPYRWLITVVGVRIVWIVRIPVIGIRVSEPADEEPRSEKAAIKTVIKEKTIVVEKVAIASKTVIETTVIETTVTETTVKPASTHVTTKRSGGNRQSPKDRDHQ